MKRRLQNSHAHLAAGEGLFAFAIALASVIYGNNSRIPAGELRRFLEMRITVINAIFAGLFMLAWIYCFRVLNLHTSDSDAVPGKLIQKVKGTVVMTSLLASYLYATHTEGPTMRIAVIFFVGVMCYEICQVVFGAWIIARDPQLVIILGSGRRAGKAWRELRTHYHASVKLLGFVDDRPVDEMAPDVAARYLGTISELSDLLLNNVVDELLIAVPMKSCYEKAQTAIAIAEQVGVHVVCMQDMYITSLKQPAYRDQEVFGELISFHQDYMTMQTVKRFVDICGALLGLCLLAPLFLLIAIAIKATSEGHVFFAQERFGYRRRTFRMYKFRSMVCNATELMVQLEKQNEASGPIFKIRQDPRITPIGRFLRASSLDELPQLWNVLIGSMSLVGPRPMSVRDVMLFNKATLMRRFTVKPGMTGLWQVSGRDSLSFEKWIEMDFNYIDRWSLALDFQILARTVRVVFNRTGSI